jgi:ion channel
VTPGPLLVIMDAPQILDPPSATHSPRFSSARARLPSRFSALLATMLGLVVLQPLLEGHWLATLLLNLLVSGMLLAGVYAVSQNKRDLLIACILAIPALLSRWLAYFNEPPGLWFVSAMLFLLFLGFTVQVILRHALQARRVTVDTLSAALCAYLLIGLIWAVLYTIMEVLSPGSFTLPPRQPSAAHEDMLLHSQFSRFIYYSFVTLTSTGFGDITPVGDSARSLSILEAIIGQFYVAVLISRLVGLHIVHSLEERESSK